MRKQFLVHLLKFFFVVINTKFKSVHSIELCEQYDHNQKLNSSFYCLQYCCGTCHFNYCCTNRAYSVNQFECRNLSMTSHSPHPLSKPVLNIKINSTNEYAYATEVYTEACGAFINKYGTILQARRCGQETRLCCGTCEERYCCNSTSEHLNQLDCKIFAIPSESSPETNSFSYVIVLLILGFILMFAFLCIPFVIYINKRAKKSDNSLIQLQNMPPLPPNFMERHSSSSSSQNTTALSTVLETPKEQTAPPKDELFDPPPYSSLNFDIIF